MDLTKLFGCRVFGDAAMREHLSREVYESLRRTREAGLPLDPSIAQAVAEGMKDWAIAQGATHYTHWFQPLTNITAGKHDAFIEPDGEGGMMLGIFLQGAHQGGAGRVELPVGRAARHL